VVAILRVLEALGKRGYERAAKDPRMKWVKGPPPTREETRLEAIQGSIEAIHEEQRAQALRLDALVQTLGSKKRR